MPTELKTTRKCLITSNYIDDYEAHTVSDALAICSYQDYPLGWYGEYTKTVIGPHPVRAGLSRDSRMFDHGASVGIKTMLLYYGDGRILEGVLLSLRGNQMRVAVKDADDVAEFRLECGVWISECCEPVTFYFPTAVFQAIGIIPDEQNSKREPDFLWHTDSTAALSIDPLN